MAVRCFLIEPTDRERRALRRYATNSARGPCPQMPGASSYHNASAPIEDGPVTPGGESDHFPGKYYVGSPPVSAFRDDPRWPTHCGCGYAFAADDEWQVFNEPIYRRPETGEEMTLREAPAGAMWDAWWMHPMHGTNSTCDPACHLMVQLPNGALEWYADGPASNGSGSGWTRTGTPPNVTAQPSIHAVGRYHGWLREGELRDA